MPVLRESAEISPRASLFNRIMNARREKAVVTMRRFAYCYVDRVCIPRPERAIKPAA